MRNKLNENQKQEIVKQYADGTSVAELCSPHGV